MKVQVLTGTKQEIAETVAGLRGEVREAIVFIDEAAEESLPLPGEDIFAEMKPFEARAGEVDYSRDSLYGERDGG